MQPRDDAAYPLDDLWRAPALIWVMVGGEGLALVLALAPGAGEDLWVYFGLLSLAIQWVNLLTLAGLYAMRRRLEGCDIHQLSFFALGMLLVNTWLVIVAAWYFFGGARDIVWADSLSLGLRATGIALTVGFLGIAAFQNYWRARQFAVRAKQSELEALQARIRPHFLFNTLNTAAALVHQRPGDAEQLLLDLADLFRAALAGPREIPLEEELSLARRYLEIESLRFGERLKVEWQLPDIVPDVAVPTLSIQPLVENAIRHGVEPSRAGGSIQIQVTQDDHAICVCVRNSLPTEGASVTNGHRVGLSSARARIGAMTQGRGSVETSIDGNTYITLLTLPRENLA